MEFRRNSDHDDCQNKNLINFSWDYMAEKDSPSRILFKQIEVGTLFLLTLLWENIHFH